VITAPTATTPPLLEISTDMGTLIVYRPDRSVMRETAEAAKAIFIEAFSTTYGEYHTQSRSVEPIEKWLHLKEGVNINEWLSSTFDEEYREYLAGQKEFLYLCNANRNLIGWLSHTPVSKTGELYLSQCSLEAKSRNHKIATATFAKVLTEGHLKEVFPGVKDVKLIARKINTVASQLYVKAGFIKDETIDPQIYGESYNDRYVGFRMKIKN
jgi:ribosomal protein S18 acetylase RimI-like enzyme